MEKLRLAAKEPTSYVFLFTLLAGLVLGYARADPPLTTAELIVILVLSLAYLYTGTVIFNSILRGGTPRQKVLYLVFQIPLGLLILYLERGNGWLALLPLVSHSVALFSPKEALLPCILITLGIAGLTTRQFPTWVPLLQSVVIFGSAVAFAAVFTEISIRSTRRKEQVEQLAAELEAANRQLQAYAARVEELSAAEERTRLAREVHDGLGHYLTALNVQAQVVERLLEQDPPAARQALTKMQAMILDALSEARRSVAALRSEPLQGKPLGEALLPLIDESNAEGLATGLYLRGEVRRLPPAVELTLYRAVQEGLTNVRKHAGARRADVELDYQPERVTLRLQDDGAGSAVSTSPLDASSGSFGLFGLRERVHLLHGSLTVHTAPGKGFCLEITLPVPNEGEAAA
jgi:signal transduction histidine kinase